MKFRGDIFLAIACKACNREKKVLLGGAGGRLSKSAPRRRMRIDKNLVSSRRKKVNSRILWKDVGFWVWVAVLLAFSLTPFVWFLLSSFKTPLQLTASPPDIWPEGGFHFFRSAVGRYHLFRFVRNSLVVAGSTTVTSLAIGSLAAYALSRLPIRGKRAILAGVLAVSMFPQISIVGPVWRILRAFGWLNSYPGLVGPYVTLTLPLAVWILASFFKELPRELEEAAKIDGCGPLKTLVRVIAPVAAPGIFTAAILIFIYAWNEFFFALLIMTRPAVQTLPVGIALFPGQYTMPWGEISAACVIATLPLVILVLLFQQRIIRGLSAGSIVQ